MIFLTLFLIPCLIALISFLIPSTKSKKINYFSRISENKVDWKELLILMGVSLVIAAISCGIIYHKNVTYNEVWNGLVSDKKQVRVSCRHSYDCNCRPVCSGSGKSYSCTTHCDTCYEHTHDHDWEVYDTTGETFDIATIDRQGEQMPPRWASVNKGDPTSSVHQYKNYIKASNNSLFRNEGKDFVKYQIPEYPIGIYDYYRLNRILLGQGVIIPDINNLQEKLSVINGRLGTSKQCNVIFLIVKNQPEKYFYAVEQKWNMANKNDIVIIISIDDKNNIQWMNTICMSKSSLFKIKLSDNILAIKTLDMNKILETTEQTVVQNFQRKRMKEYKYLEANISPTLSQFLWALGINCVICIGLAIVFYKNEFFK